MKKILISLAMIAAVGAIVVGATTAYFSDTETSTGNTFTAGAIDLGIDNESYYNGAVSTSTSWEIAYDLDDKNGPSHGAYLFFNFADLKPGDYGEDTISIRVNNNDSWACSETTVTDDRDNDCTEPENDIDAENGECDVNNEPWSGDLADQIEIMWWADDGDNVYEKGEEYIDLGNLGQAPQGQPVTVTLADTNNNIWTNTSGTPLPGATTKYIAKAWCFGDLTPAPLAKGSYDGPDQNNDGQNGITSEDGGFNCAGASVINNNASQSDSVTLGVIFRAEQARNNGTFICR